MALGITHSVQQIGEIIVKELESRPFVKAFDGQKIVLNKNGGKVIRYINLEIKREPGIYFIYDKNKSLRYIGETMDFQNRISGHKIRADYVKTIKLNSDKAFRIAIEQICIALFKPKENVEW